MDKSKLSPKLRALFEIAAPDETQRVRCPNCFYVLAEGLFGGARFRCRSCKWEGVVVRGAHFVTQQAETLTEGNETGRVKWMRMHTAHQSTAARARVQMAQEFVETRRLFQESLVMREESHEQE